MKFMRRVVVISCIVNRVNKDIQYLQGGSLNPPRREWVVDSSQPYDYSALCRTCKMLGSAAYKYANLSHCLDKALRQIIANLV